MKYCPEITQQIANLLKEGSNRTDACTLADISYETFTQWMLKSEFAEAIKKAEASCKNRNIAIIQKAAITTWQAAAWWLERKHREEFALKNDHSFADQEVPQRMADRAAELLKKLEASRGSNKPVHS
jgi:hypothetical protein